LEGDIPCHADFFDAIDRIALNREFTSANNRMDTFKYWKDELPRYQRMKAEREQKVQEHWDSMPKHLIG
jgi:uncharacterized protein (DUF1786 family)